jgi:hypothetical protein
LASYVSKLANELAVATRAIDWTMVSAAPLRRRTVQRSQAMDETLAGKAFGMPATFAAEP